MYEHFVEADAAGRNTIGKQQLHSSIHGHTYEMSHGDTPAANYPQRNPLGGNLPAKCSNILNAKIWGKMH